ncbi:MAG: hypothetical protein JZU47_04495 [Prolixibacteraceae bacterium]|nr:hypothetical protein [Prolixibacteraceae bacterium]
MKFSKNQLIAFLFGLGATISIRMVGIFAISDLIAIFFLPFLAFKQNMFVDRRFRRVIILLLLWMASTVVSDIYNHSTMTNAAKGFFTLVPFLACLIFAYWLLRKNYELMIPFLWGYVISFTLSAGFGFDAFYIEMIQTKGVAGVTQLDHYNKIKVWIISAFISGAFAITYFKRFPRFVTLVIFSFSFIVLLDGSRSIFLIYFIVAISLIYILRITKNLHWDGDIWSMNLQRKVTRFSFYIIVLIFAAKGVYSFSATNGYLGENERQKYDDQSSTKIGLFSGRGEIISSFLAIKDSPILGHGSYAIDNVGYGYQAAKLIGANDLSLEWNMNRIGENYIPTHSHIWQAWVYNGFLGGVFWIYILIGVLIVYISKYLFLYPRYQAYILCSLANAIWNILFSPFSQRPLLATSLVFFIVLMQAEDQTKQN